MSSPLVFIPTGILVFVSCAAVGVILFCARGLWQGEGWRKFFLTVAAIALLCCLGGLFAVGFQVGIAGAPPEWAEGTSPRLESLMRRSCRDHVARGKSTGLVVAVVKDGEKGLMGFGTTALIFGQPVTGDTLFEIGSITKTFTGILLARKIGAGLVDLDQPLQELLQVPMPSGAQGVTLRHLTTHTSGFPRLPMGKFVLMTGGLKMLLLGSDPYAGLTEQDYLESLRTLELESRPGVKLSYSNFGFTMLGYVLARKSGREYEDLVKSEICLPLGMASTTVTLSDRQRSEFASPYRTLRKTGIVELGLLSHPWNDLKNLEGAGGLRSTGRDMLRYLEANMHPAGQPIASALQESHKQLFRKGDQVSWGMGWVRTEKKRLNGVMIWHNGGTGGFRSFLGFTEDGRHGVVVMANSAEDVDELGVRMLEEIVLLDAKPAAGS